MPLNEGRGRETPATHARLRPPPVTTMPLNEGRGVNPGDTPAHRMRCCRRRTLNEGRGANPGDTSCAGNGPDSGKPLNEGRGVNPGDTRQEGGWGLAAAVRSTKAGA